jgi:hypothetical protein
MLEQPVNRRAAVCVKLNLFKRLFFRHLPMFTSDSPENFMDLGQLLHRRLVIVQAM